MVRMGQVFTERSVRLWGKEMEFDFVKSPF